MRHFELYPTVKLQPKREQSWLFGHPWIFSRAIQKMPHLDPGILVRVLDSNEHSLGVGTLNFEQSIALRMFQKPIEPIDAAWFEKILLKLNAYRRNLLEEKTNAFRLCYGESDGIPGLVIDRYADSAVIQVNTKGIERLLGPLVQSMPKLGIREWIIKADSVSAKLEKVKIDESLSVIHHEILWALENGLNILVPLRGGQKTGWFCDQRENRKIVGQLVKDLRLRSVLNLFSYTGGFSLAALQAGSQNVVNVDQDADALEMFNEMVSKNNLNSKSESICANVWEYLAKTSETFELVIVDPPAFVKEASKKMQGLKGYKDLLKQSIPKVASGGLLMLFSCSHFITVEDLQWACRQAFAETGRYFQTVKELSQGFDHPVPVWFPEAKYLKGFLLKELC